MFAKKVKNNEKKSGDLELLLEAMDKVIAGEFGDVDTSVFEDSEVGKKLNDVLRAFKKSNNNFVMRLNNTMLSIGDNSYLKKMFDQLNLQTSSIKEMEASSKNLESSIVNISNSVAHINENASQVLKASEQSEVNMNESIRVVNDSSSDIARINVQVQTFREKINKISEIIDMVKKIASQSNLLALNASIEAARAGEAGKGFAVVADQVRQLSSNTSVSAEDIVRTVTELQVNIGELAQAMDTTTIRLADGNQKVEQSVRDIQQINLQINTISEEIKSIYGAVDTQSLVTREFGNQIENMSESYEELSTDCQEVGNHIFKSRYYVDTVRSDMYRGFSEVTKIDNLTVFESDHFILAWRVYNHAKGFEVLEFEQLSNVHGCKLGKWIGAQTDTRLTGSQAFKDLVNCHEELHKHAVDSFKAKEKGDVETAIFHFNLVLETYNRFKKVIPKVKDVYRSMGETEETQIKVYTT